ncbi:hypothetical protein BKA70DRAFT_1229264 [Coprinopsis sp. MPI-PUGE-AT-0042]|nr:hypothetical protein BKA70DRAFT_1229264 [Coprinopsis sp. MPI-PUGE-AT-0042]
MIEKTAAVKSKSHQPTGLRRRFPLIQGPPSPSLLRSKCTIARLPPRSEEQSKDKPSPLRRRYSFHPKTGPKGKGKALYRSVSIQAAASSSLLTSQTSLRDQTRGGRQSGELSHGTTIEKVEEMFSDGSGRYVWHKAISEQMFDRPPPGLSAQKGDLFVNFHSSGVNAWLMNGMWTPTREGLQHPVLPSQQLHIQISGLPVWRMAWRVVARPARR